MGQLVLVQPVQHIGLILFLVGGSPQGVAPMSLAEPHSGVMTGSQVVGIPG